MSGYLETGVVLCFLLSCVVLGDKQEKVTRDAVKKIEIIENTLGEIEDIFIDKESMINDMNIEINQLRENLQVSNNKLTANLEELKLCKDDNEMFSVFQSFETNNLKSEIENHQQFIDSQANEIHRLEKKISNLESTQTSNILRRQEEAHEWKECEFLRSQLQGVRQEYEEYKQMVEQNLTNVDNQNFMFERAVVSLKEVIRENNLQIIDLKGEIDYNHKMGKEKDMRIELQNEKITEYVENEKILQRQLESSEIAINERDLMINNLANELSSLKSYKDILAGVINQLKTINSPDFDFGHFMDTMDRVKRKTENNDNQNTLQRDKNKDSEENKGKENIIKKEETMDSNLKQMENEKQSYVELDDLDETDIMISKMSQNKTIDSEGESSKISPYHFVQSEQHNVVKNNSQPAIQLPSDVNHSEIPALETLPLIHPPQYIHESQYPETTTSATLTSQPSSIVASSVTAVPMITPVSMLLEAVKTSLPTVQPDTNTARPRKMWATSTPSPDSLLLVTPFVWKHQQRTNYKYAKRKIGKKVPRPRKRIREKTGVHQK